MHRRQRLASSGLCYEHDLEAASGGNKVMHRPPFSCSLLATLLLTASPGATQASDTTQSSADQDLADEWFLADDVEAVPQVGAGELLFLAAPPDSRTPLSDNRIIVTEASITDGWVHLDQCYSGLDAVPDAEVVYRYRDMRGLRIVATQNIGEATAGQRSVQLKDVRHDARLCIAAEVRILYVLPDGRRVLRNGPFHRKFLDGYFPLHVSLQVQYPASALRYLGISPQAQPGFAVAADDGRLRVDSWFAGELNIEISFGLQQQDPAGVP